jgi:hypothetical protein
MTDIVDRLRITHFMDGHEVGVTTQRAEAADEIERLRALLEPCRPDTDAQTDPRYPKTVDDVLSLLSAYIADFMPAESVPGDEYFGAWERQARKVVEPIMRERDEARAQLAVANTAIHGMEQNRDAWHDQAVKLEEQLVELQRIMADLYPALHRELDETHRKLTEAIAQRDAAFAMTRCECGPDECCQNLVRLHKQLAEARAANEALLKTLHGAYELLSVVTDDLREAAEAGGDRDEPYKR